MYLTVGEIAKSVGLSPETIRYYVKEGLITPKKNEENNYWEYSSDDLMKITDILFYRSMNLTMKEIKIIMGGIPLEDIGDVINARKNDLIAEIKTMTDAMYDLNHWHELYLAEMKLIGNFIIGEMPTELRREGVLEEAQHMAEYLQQCFDLDKEDWQDVSISFFYDQNCPENGMSRYLSIRGSRKMQASNLNEPAIKENAAHCLITEARYSDDVYEMIQPMIDYAKENHITLEGTFYGRENTNYFIDGHRSGLYKVYAPIVK